MNVLTQPRHGRQNASSEYVTELRKEQTGYGAYVPDLSGCAVIGRPLNVTKQRIKTAMENSIPEPTTDIDYIEVPDVACFADVAPSDEGLATSDMRG